MYHNDTYVVGYIWNAQKWFDGNSSLFSFLTFNNLALYQNLVLNLRKLSKKLKFLDSPNETKKMRRIFKD